MKFKTLQTQCNLVKTFFEKTKIIIDAFDKNDLNETHFNQLKLFENQIKKKLNDFESSFAKFYDQDDLPNDFNEDTANDINSNITILGLNILATITSLLPLPQN